MGTRHPDLHPCSSARLGEAQARFSPCLHIYVLTRSEQAFLAMLAERKCPANVNRLALGTWPT